MTICDGGIFICSISFRDDRRTTLHVSIIDSGSNVVKRAVNFVGSKSR